MPTINIAEPGCRGCSLCKEVCPTDVFDFDDKREVAVAQRQEDCIGCTSCEYICPSHCLEVEDYKVQRPFYRIQQNTKLVSRFLQQQPVSKALTDADYQEAVLDIRTRLLALSQSLSQTVGRGQKALGRRAGKLAASHLPEMYEGKTLAEVLDRLQLRFRDSFDFEYEEAGGAFALKFTGCAIHRVLEGSDEEVGTANLCSIFHEYWAGLLSAFTDCPYTVELVRAGPPCELKLFSKS